MRRYNSIKISSGQVSKLKPVLEQKSIFGSLGNSPFRLVQSQLNNLKSEINAKQKSNSVYGQLNHLVPTLWPGCGRVTQIQEEVEEFGLQKSVFPCEEREHVGSQKRQQ